MYVISFITICVVKQKILELLFNNKYSRIRENIYTIAPQFPHFIDGYVKFTWTRTAI